MIIATGIINCIKRINDIVQDDKNRKAAIEEDQIKKDYAKKSMIAYAETLAKNTTQKEFEYIVNEQEGVFFGDLDKSILDACKTEYCMITESVSRKEMEAMYPELDEPDITITKTQARLVSELIDFYIDNDKTCSSINEDNLISLMSKLSGSGV